MNAEVAKGKAMQTPGCKSQALSPTIRALLLPLAVIVLAVTWTLKPAWAQCLSAGEGNLRVMTYNVYEGADLSVALGAQAFPQFLAAVTTILNNVQASNPPERAAAVARQIGEAQPTLLSLQEVTQWQTCPTVDFQTCATPPTLLFDLLQLIQDALQQQGHAYKLVWAQTTNNLAAPSSTGLIVFYTQRIAVLARADIDPNQLRLSNVQSAQFAASFTPTVLGSVLPVHRAWISADVKFHDTNFRFINTQLESFDPNVNYDQGQELLSGPANTSLPVIMAMDSNSKANTPPDATTPTYQNFMGCGFTDAWTAANPNDVGLTCCQDPLLRNAVSMVTERIDLILVRGGVDVKAAHLFGGALADRTPSGLWPSDHVAVAARLKAQSDEDQD